MITRHVAAAVEEDGKVPMLHVLVDNPARRLYERTGFAMVRTYPGAVVRPAPR